MPTSLRAVIDRYYPALDPRRAKTGPDEFPVKHQPHGRDASRSLVPGFEKVLCFHIGQAFLGYYDVVLGVENPGAEQAVARLEALAGQLTNTLVDGSPSTGYVIVTREESNQLKADREAEDTARIDERTR